MTDKINIIYILGAGHSGSTLLNFVLGAHSKIQSVGELKNYFSLISNEEALAKSENFCSCGDSLTKCEFWATVFKDMSGDISYKIDLNSKNQKEFEKNNFEFLSYIIKITGKRYICDISKNLDRLERYLQSDLFNVKIIHLIRDPRAYVFSMKRASLRKKKNNQLKNNPYGFKNAILRWRKNHQFYKKFCSMSNYHILKYEDLVNNFDHAVNKLCRFMELDFEDNFHTFNEIPQHLMSGNRMRLSADKSIKFDQTYILETSFFKWWLINYKLFKEIKIFKYPFAKSNE